MASFEEYATGTSQHIAYDHSHPGFFNSMPTLPNTIFNSAQTSLHCAAEWDSATSHGRYESHYFGGVAMEHAELLQSSMRLGSYPNYCCLGDKFCWECLQNGPNKGDIFDSEFDIETQLVDEPVESLYGSPLEIERLDDGYSPLSASSFHSVQVSDTTFTSGPTTTSSPECMLERSCCTSEVAEKQIETIKGGLKEKVNRKRKRSAETKKNYCEIRISKKIPTDGKCQKGKAWLGTYATPDQAGRAHDVGKYFLCAKKKKVFYDPNSEVILSTFKDQLQALPLTELVENVTRMAKHYGENGSFIGYQGIEAIQSNPGAVGIP